MVGMSAETGVPAWTDDISTMAERQRPEGQGKAPHPKPEDLGIQGKALKQGEPALTQEGNKLGIPFEKNRSGEVCWVGPADLLA